MPWTYFSTARTALHSLQHPPESTRLCLQRSTSFASAWNPINLRQLPCDQIHAPRRIHARNAPHSQSTSTRSLLSTVQFTNRLVSRILSQRESLRYQISATRFSSTLASEQVWDRGDISNPEQPTPPFDISSTLTPAQTSRAARQAVNFALQNYTRGFHVALHIVNSLHHPILKQDPDAADQPNVTSYPAITFNQSVSPRLSSHALVHGLIRRKELKHAATLAMAMMQCGMHVHSRTLNVVMQFLKPERPELSILKATMPKNFRPNPTSFSDLAGMAEQASTRLALEIFAVARRTGQGNMRRLFSTLLAICVLNTEIVLASLAFAMVVKEFYHPPPSPEGDTTENTWNAEKYGPRSLVFLPQWTHLTDLTNPMKDYFRRITTLNTASVLFEQESLDANLQALAILANLLDLRQLHLSTIATLVTLMYNTPRTNSEVWVVDEEGNAREVAAFQYLHDVLVRLIESPPPPGGPGTKKQNCRAFTPPLGINTCNALLHYALRHCHSPSLGNKVLIHVTQARKLNPDDTTYNILLRSGTLLRNKDLASLALSAMANTTQDRKQRGSSLKLKFDGGSPLRAMSRSQSDIARQIASAIETINSSHLWPFSQNRLATLEHALYKLTTLIMHFCSTGQPYFVKSIIFALFPALIRHSSTPLDEHMHQRRKAIRQGARFGPLPFTVMLNALVKARAFSEARLLYNFAVAAERRSWFTPKPWVLGTEAYTIMLELCGAECRHATMLQRIPTTGQDETANDVRIKAVRMALRLFKRINRIYYTSHNTMRRYGHLAHFEKLILPKPDERFATALIRVLGILSKHIDPTTVATADISLQHRRPYSRVQTKISPASASKMYSESEETFRVYGDLPKGWTQQLHFIAHGIVRTGMKLPPALRHLFLGRYDEAANPLKRREEGAPLRVIPWAYDGERKRETWHPWIVPSVRTRGLLVRKMTRLQRRRWNDPRKRTGLR